jgi:hypothetical protein
MMLIELYQHLIVRVKLKEVKKAGSGSPNHQRATVFVLYYNS